MNKKIDWYQKLRDHKGSAIVYFEYKGQKPRVIGRPYKFKIRRVTNRKIKGQYVGWNVINSNSCDVCSTFIPACYEAKVMTYKQTIDAMEEYDTGEYNTFATGKIIHVDFFKD